MKRIVLIAAVYSLTALSSYSQTPTTPPVISPCRLTVGQAPVIRDVKLGMKAEDLLALFPGSAERSDIKLLIGEADTYPNFGVVNIFVNPRDYTTRDRFTGIANFRLVLLDGRVTQYEVEYHSAPIGPTWHRVDDFIAKVADSFGLPAATDWVGNQDNSSQKNLKCNGFQLQASNMNFRGSLIVSTLDPPSKMQRERRAAFEEKVRREFKP